MGGFLLPPGLALPKDKGSSEAASNPSVKSKEISIVVVSQRSVSNKTKLIYFNFIAGSIIG